MIRKTLSVGIVFLFIITSVTPMVIGNRTETKDNDNELEATLANLRYLCTTPDGFDDAKYDYYKEELVDSYSKDDTAVVEPVEAVVQDDLLLPLDGPMDSPWPMKCHDIHHTSRSPYSTAHIDGLEKWRFRADDWVNAGMIIGDDGTIYFGDFDRYIYALNSNGTERWRYGKTGGWISSAPALAEDGTLYVGSWDAKLYALNSSTGALKWTVGGGASISSSPAIAEDGTIYFGSMMGGDGYRISAINPNGTVKWYYYTGYSIVSDPAIGDDGTVYIGSADNYLYALYPNGTLKWRFKTGDIIKSPASIADDGTVYIGSFDDYLYALYPNNGTMKWKCKVGYGTETNPSIASDGTIYIGGQKLYAIYPDGTMRWSFDLGPECYITQSSPAISADGTIYVGTNIGETSGGNIIAVNPDGTERWRKLIADEWVESSPCIGEDGTLYIGSASEGRGYIHAFGPVESNSPPETPTISGETNGHVREGYWYKLKSVDPDNNPISWYIDWGDGTNTGWTSERASEENCYYEHAWLIRGDYTIRCKAKDVLGEESDWATLEVTMPVNQHFYSFPLLQRLLDRFPNAFPILRQLLGL